MLVATHSANFAPCNLLEQARCKAEEVIGNPITHEPIKKRTMKTTDSLGVCLHVGNMLVYVQQHR